jgi:hypothetical protein
MDKFVYFTATMGLRGYFAIIYDAAGPIQSSPTTHSSYYDALVDASEWAKESYGDYWKQHMTQDDLKELGAA